MKQDSVEDWDPRSEPVLKNQIAAYDEMRQRCPVANSRHGYTSVFRHHDVMRIVEDPETFSNAVSRFPSVPNGMDPPQHIEFRRILDGYFSPEAMAAFEPACREIAVELTDKLPEDGETDLMTELADIFALQIQCAFMGWPCELHEPLHQWTRKNHAATLNKDEAAMSAVAFEFDGYIKELLDIRYKAGANAPRDVTTALLQEQVFGRRVTADEVVSIIRNWTVGELSTIAASVSILAHYLAANPELQQQLRTQPGLIPQANEEILRMHSPLVMSRRVTTRPVSIRDRELPARRRVAVIWASANRDESVFGEPDELRLDRNPALNLVYGAGIHVCPGAPLARLELRVVMETLLERTSWVSLMPDKEAKRAFYPASGFSSLPLHIRRAPAR